MARCEETVSTPNSPNFGKQCQRLAMHGTQRCFVHSDRTNLPAKVEIGRIDRPRVQCSATKRSGERCRNYAIHGSTVCTRHGGNLPGVKNAARQRLLNLVSPALAELQRIIDSSTTSDADRLKAIQLVLDRTGYHARTELTIDAELKPWEALTGGEIVRDLPDDPNLPIIDAEVVYDDDEPEDDGTPRAIEQLADVLPISAGPKRSKSSAQPPLHLR